MVGVASAAGMEKCIVPNLAILLQMVMIDLIRGWRVGVLGPIIPGKNEDGL